MRILGLDIGTHSVKGVELDASFKKFQIHNYHDLPIAPGEKPSQVAKRLVESLKKRPDRIVIGLPSHQATFRNLAAPSKNKKALQAAVAFELEDELPFEMDDATFDFAILRQNKGLADVHAEATLTQYVENLVQELRSEGLEPEIITSPIWAYRCLLNRVITQPEDQDRPTLLFHMGHHSTDLYLHWQGQPIAFRSLNIGSQKITQAIMEKYKLSEAEAKKTQIENGFILTQSQRENASREQLEFSDTIEGALKSLLAETRQFSLSAAANAKRPTAKIYLSGPSTLMPGFKSFFEDHVRISASHLRAFSKTSPTPIEYADGTEASLTLALGLAFTLIASDKMKPINFRKGSFSQKGLSSGWTWNRVRHPLTATLAVGLAFFISMGFQKSYYQAEIEKIDTRLKSKAKNFLGSIPQSKMNLYLESPDEMKEAIQKKLTAQRTLAQFLTSDARSPFKFLKTLSQDIPRSVVVDMVHFQVGAASNNYDPKATQDVQLSFLFESPPTEERLSSILMNLVDEVKKDPTTQEPSLDGQGQKWKVTFTGKTKSESKGVGDGN